MQQPLQTIPGLPGLAQLPPGMPPLGALPPGLPSPGMPPGLSAVLAGLPGAPPGLPPQPPQNVDWIAQLAAIQAAQPPQVATAPTPGTAGIATPGLAAWGLGGQTFPSPPAPGAPAGALPPGLAAVPTLPQAWGQPNDALAALLGGAVGQAPSDGSALGLNPPSAPPPPPGTAVADSAVLSQISQLPQMAPPLAPPPLQAFPPPAPPPAGAPAPPPPATPSASQLESARREEERKERMKRESKEQAERQAERREKMDQVEKKKCHLHKKLKDSCKFCKKYKELLDELERSQKNEEDSGNRRKRKLDRAISEERDGQAEIVPLAVQKNFGFAGLLQTHIVECAHFKSLLTLETFEQLVDETYQFANAVEPYMANSGTLPTALFCCIYRFFTLGLDSRQLRRLLDAQESPYVRCAGFLYARYGIVPDQLWDWIGDYLLDDELFKPSSDSDSQITIGEYVEGLLAQDKYYNTVFPRLPGSTRRKLEEKLAPVSQYRKRTKANKEILDIYREPGTKIEACIDGDWLRGTTIELDDGRPNRVKVQLRLEDGSEDTVHLGMIIATDERSSSRKARGRSRSRSPGGSRVDWSRHKGRSDKELVNEMRNREREKAVCSSGKDYARKPLGYKAACALPREQGAASYRLMEEETFVPMSRTSTRGRTPSPQRENKRPSAEHQARMQQLFEKYGNVKSAEARQASSLEVDRPEVMRFG